MSATSPAAPFKPVFCFWRTPEARPHRGTEGKYDGKFAPDEILAAWGRASFLDPSGKLSLQGFAHIQLEAALKLAFVVVGKDGVELDEDDSWGIAREALCNVAITNGGGKPVGHFDFMREADVVAAKFFQRATTRYVFVTSLSVSSLPTKTITIRGCKIRAMASRGKFRVPAIVTSGQVPSVYKNHVEKTRYRWIAVSTHGRTPNDAFNRAFDAVALLRALWTFAATAGSSALHFGAGAPDPLSAVHIGPIQTLHELNGNPISDDFFWREIDPREDRQLFAPTAGWAKLEDARQTLSRKISRLPYREDMEELLLRYIRALDHTNHDLVMLHVWSIIERITGLIGARYDEAIERASWFMQDRRLHKQLLNCVRLQRNRFVHSSNPASEADQIAYLTKNILEEHLRALIWNYLNVPSLAEYAEMLAMPVDPATLKLQQKRLVLALRFHAPNPRKPPPATPSPPPTPGSAGPTTGTVSS